MIPNRSLAYLAAILAFSATTLTAGSRVESISISAWVEGGTCTATPKFEATLNIKSVPILAQSGPGSDQIVLVVFDLSGDLSLLAAAKESISAEISKLPKNAWVGVLRSGDGLRVLA